VRHSLQVDVYTGPYERHSSGCVHPDLDPHKTNQNLATMDDSLLQKITKYQFNNPDLLRAAYTRGTKGSQLEIKRLALIGDAVLTLDIAERGYKAGASSGAGHINRLLFGEF